jgi:hypothetical protein
MAGLVLRSRRSLLLTAIWFAFTRRSAVAHHAGALCDIPNSVSLISLMRGGRAPLRLASCLVSRGAVSSIPRSAAFCLLPLDTCASFLPLSATSRKRVSSCFKLLIKRVI